MSVLKHSILDRTGGRQVPAGLCALGVMTKAPEPGKVKTRLTPPLTSEEAASLNIRFLRDTAAAISAASRQSPARGIGIYTPVGAEAAYDEILPSAFALIPQRGDGFGERLGFAIEDLLAVGFDGVCLINSDSPTVPIEAYADAAHALTQPGDRVVFGPSDDGGYYLIGMKLLHHRLFAEIDWSTERVADQTLARAAELELEVRFLPTWYDVDDWRTLRRLCDELLSAPETDASGFAAPATRDYLARLIDSGERDRIWPNE